MAVPERAVRLLEVTDFDLRSIRAYDDNRSGCEDRDEKKAGEDRRLEKRIESGW
jgi:hypothetical protein